MYDVSLICTHHHELGKCNSDELYKILEDLNPEVIFDELPSDSFDRYYGDSSNIFYANSVLLNRRIPKMLLEVKCIKKYQENHNVEIVLVDTNARQELSDYNDEILAMNCTFLNREDYVMLFNENETLIEHEGFQYLNSDKFMAHLEKKEVMERDIIESETNKNALLDTYKLFHTIHDNRENLMLENIYNYSKKYQYNRAVFLIGAAHKRSLMQKINEHKKRSETKLNWTMYNNE